MNTQGSLSGSTSNAERQEYRVEGLNEPVGHYTDAVRFKDLLFLSGVASLDEACKIVGADDIIVQTRKTLSNMQLVLRAAGADFCDLLKVTIYVTDVKDMAKINIVRKEMFGEARPASTMVEVSRLALPDMKIEIEAVAGIPSTTSSGNR